MSAVNSVNSTLVSGTTTQAGFSDEVMGKEDFLKLLVAQLQHQDPLNPQDPTEFTAQLAQYSQVEQSINMNKNLESLAGMTYDMERMSAMGMIGNDVTVEANTFRSNGEAVELGYRLDGKADVAKVHILDGSGRTVRTLNATELRAGEHFLTWDGKDANGGALPNGTYYLSVVATDAEEKLIASQALLRSKVTGIDLDGKKSQVVTDAGTFALSKVSEVLGG